MYYKVVFSDGGNIEDVICDNEDDVAATMASLQQQGYDIISMEKYDPNDDQDYIY